ncbi:MAG: hypothetical protein GX547_11225 [Phycisphaerae bacterium]|nr:hypothetical protein [Phycisphaerae bacterium]
MIGPFPYHVFAHRDGRYQTAERSAGVTPAENALLEQFFFGQTNDPEYLASLSSEPGVIWRRCGERFLLTRVLSGGPDAHGRATLRFETLLIPADSAPSVVRVLDAVVLSRWEKSRAGATITELSASSRDTLHPEVVSSVAQAVAASRRTIHSATNISLKDIQAIVQRCLALPEFSLCFKCLTSGAPVAVAFLYGSGPPTPANLPMEKTPLSQFPRSGSAPAARFATAGVLAVSLVVVLLLANMAAMIHITTRLSSFDRYQNDMQQKILNPVFETRGDVQKSLEQGDQLAAMQDALKQMLGKTATAESLAELANSQRGAKDAIEGAIREGDETLLTKLGELRDASLSTANNVEAIKQELEKLKAPPEPPKAAPEAPKAEDRTQALADRLKTIKDLADYHVKRLTSAIDKLKTQQRARNLLDVEKEALRQMERQAEDFLEAWKNIAEKATLDAP